jgi:excisionase family DNA binding protein
MKLLTVTDFAHVINTSRSMAYKLIQDGKIAHIAIGNAIRIREEDLMAFIKRNRRTGIIDARRKRRRV